MTASFDLKAYLNECRALSDAHLKASLPPKETYPAKLYEAMHYSIFAGGKRVRPVLCLAGAEACGGKREAALPVATAMEMIHVFSLIHDDLPAMDDDNMRRGVPTNHRVYGEATAILAGDALLAEAFVVLARLADHGVEPKRVIEIMKDIAMATGAAGMVGGQQADLDAEGKQIDLDSLKRLHRLKTGCLISASVLNGAKTATSDIVKLTALENYGRAVGLAFQIADDILDIEGGEDLGKDIGSDVENGKSTYPSVMGLADAKTELGRQLEEALNALKTFGPEATALREIARYVVERKN